jgi:tRNA threonylcarbamoyl adenosine modification protein YeaZ
MRILAIEFSTERRSVAVINPSEEAISATAWEDIDPASRRIAALSLVEQALRDAKVEREGIDCIAIGLGPGSYTGIRSAIALAQGWQLGRTINVLGISSGECLAARAQKEKMYGRINIVIDAQRQEFYLAGYAIAKTDYREVEPLHIATFNEVQTHHAAGELIVGPQVSRYFPRSRLLFPDAAALGGLAFDRTDFISGENLEPIYLREISFVKAPLSRRKKEI